MCTRIYRYLLILFSFLLDVDNGIYLISLCAALCISHLVNTICGGKKFVEIMPFSFLVSIIFARYLLPPRYS